MEARLFVGEASQLCWQCKISQMRGMVGKGGRNEQGKQQKMVLAGQARGFGSWQTRLACS